jgi:hypothetical protein
VQASYRPYDEQSQWLPPPDRPLFLTSASQGPFEQS